MSYTRTAADDPSDAWFEDFIVGSKAQQAALYEDYQIIQEERFQLGQYDATCASFNGSEKAPMSLPSMLKPSFEPALTISILPRLNHSNP